MNKIYHINGGSLQVSGQPRAVCHCILIVCHPEELVLIDAGIGLEDAENPEGRIGNTIINAAGFQFNRSDTVTTRISALGFDPQNVRHIVLTHLDADHVGGAADFPNANLHLSEEEYAAFRGGHPRYAQPQLAYGPGITSYRASGDTWFGLEARQVLSLSSIEMYLIPLFGHTAGHCGVAVRNRSGWLFHVGDAYYLRDELHHNDHPVSELARASAVDDAARTISLDRIRRLYRKFGSEMHIFGYHDERELLQFAVSDLKR